MLLLLYIHSKKNPCLTFHLGIIKGDEMMVINGAIVSDLDMMFIESVLQEELSLCMMMRSARTGQIQFIFLIALSNP